MGITITKVIAVPNTTIIKVAIAMAGSAARNCAGARGEELRCSVADAVVH